MALANAALYAFNKAADGDIVASSEAGDFIAENLLDSQPGRIWRGVGKEAHTIEGDFGGTGEAVSSFALTNHNLDELVTVKLELFDADGATVLYTATWDAVSPVLGWGEGAWGDVPNIGGYVNGGWTSRNLIKLFSPITAWSYKVTIDNMESYQDDNYPQAGLLFIGYPFQPQHKNVMADPAIPVEDPTRLIVTRSQALRSDPMEPYRVMEWTWGFLTTEETVEFREMCRLVGKRSAIVASLWPGDDTGREVEGQMLCRIVDWTGPEKLPSTITDYYRASVTLREVI